MDHNQIKATVDMPSRGTAEKPGVAMRYTKALPIQSVTVNGKPWTILCCDKEAIMLRGMTGRVTVVAKYWMGMPASAVVAHVSIGALVRRHRSLELGLGVRLTAIGKFVRRASTWGGFGQRRGHKPLDSLLLNPISRFGDGPRGTVGP